MWINDLGIGPCIWAVFFVTFCNIPVPHQHGTFITVASENLPGDAKGSVTSWDRISAVRKHEGSLQAKQWHNLHSGRIMPSSGNAREPPQWEWEALVCNLQILYLYLKGKQYKLSSRALSWRDESNITALFCNSQETFRILHKTIQRSSGLMLY